MKKKIQILQEKNDSYKILTAKHTDMVNKFNTEKQNLLATINSKEAELRQQNAKYNEMIKILQEKHNYNIAKIRDREQEVLKLYKNLSKTMNDKILETKTEKQNVQKLLQEMTKNLADEKKYVSTQLTDIKKREQTLLAKENEYKRRISELTAKEMDFQRNKLQNIAAGDIVINLGEEDDIIKNLDLNFERIKKEIDVKFNDI